MRCASNPRGSFLFLCLALLVATLVGVRPATASAETLPHYDIRLSLNFSTATLDAVQKTTLRNNTGVELSELVFQVTPAYFKAFSLHSAAVDGKNVSASMDGTVLTLKLNSPLGAGTSTEVELRYTVKVPGVGGRFGRGNGVIALGNWFPVLSAYSNGWDRHQYVDVGDAFYTEVANFDVTVDSDVPVVIAASGSSTTQEGTHHSFHAEGLRDFAMAISDRYQTRSQEVDGIQVTAYAPSAAHAAIYLSEAVKTLHWYSTHLVPYPYTTFSVAEVSSASNLPTAQEYPALIMVYPALGADGGGTGSYSEYTVAHEVAHQWFYSLVGDDQIHDPWLDEAIASYMDLLYYRDQAPRFFDYYMGRTVSGYQARVAAGTDLPVNTTIYDYPNDLPYFDIVYRKGTIFLDKLRTLMGEEQFLSLMRDYIRTYANKVAFPRAFLDMAYTRAGPALPPLIAQYFSYGAFAGGKGYQLQVSWPNKLTSSGSATLSYQASFPVADVKVWLDNRLLYHGTGGHPVKLSLTGVEEGEYVLRLDLLNNQGALYQRGERAKVGPRPVATPTPSASKEMETGSALAQRENKAGSSAAQDVNGLNPTPHPVNTPGGTFTPPPRGEGHNSLSLWERVRVRVLSLLDDAIRGLNLRRLP